MRSPPTGARATRLLACTNCLALREPALSCTHEFKKRAADIDSLGVCTRR